MTSQSRGPGLRLTNRASENHRLDSHDDPRNLPPDETGCNPPIIYRNPRAPMPELPEVEVLVRHLAPVLANRIIRDVEVRRSKILRPTSERQIRDRLRGARIAGVSRRGKYLLFTLEGARTKAPFQLVGHLGMTGRMYLQPSAAPLPKHTAVAFDLGDARFVFEDTRYFGRLTLDTTAIAALGPEPFDEAFSVDYFATALRRSAQSIKVKLLDQSLVAGVGNIYASEALFCAGISPRLAARRLAREQVERLRETIRSVLDEAIGLGSTVPLNWGAETGERNGLFYYGLTSGTSRYYEERLRVYDRAGEPCVRCGVSIQRLVQAARSTYYCPGCQTGRRVTAKIKPAKIS